MTLGQLIEWLEANPGLDVRDGIGDPHSDRGFYEDVAFDIEMMTNTTDMLEHARSALGATFEGYKGGDFKMESYTIARLGAWGECGEEITSAHLACWRNGIKIYE